MPETSTGTARRLGLIGGIGLTEVHVYAQRCGVLRPVLSLNRV